MSKQINAIIVSAALVFGFSGVAHADAVKHRDHVAKAARPSPEALLRKLPDQNIYGMAIAKPRSSSCDNITCPGYSLIGIGF